jgi:hypothetical protein
MKKKCKWPIIVLAVIIGLSMTACDNGDNGNNGGGNDVRTPPTGLYLGIIGFNDYITLKEISFLSSGNKAQFQAFINNLDMTRGDTGSYYAVDKAINWLQTAKLPDDLASVSIVTFTDGLDNVSFELKGFDGTTQEEYQDVIKDRIATTKIMNKPINAYSIGIKGGDVTAAEPAFRNSLAALASDPSNVHEVNSPANRDDIGAKRAEVINKFTTIAESLYNAAQAGESAVIMLVLDCTSSLDDTAMLGIGSLCIKDAAKNFIDILINGGGSAAAGTGINTAGLLTEGLWTNGTLASASNVQFYKVNVTTGIPYYFWWNEYENPVYGKTADVQVSFSSDGGAAWSGWIDSAWLVGYNYPVHRSGTLYIRVRPCSGSGSFTGTYAITYRRYTNTRP